MSIGGLPHERPLQRFLDFVRLFSKGHLHAKCPKIEDSSVKSWTSAFLSLWSCNGRVHRAGVACCGDWLWIAILDVSMLLYDWEPLA